MASSEISDPNERRYVAKNEGKYLATRIITHAGVTIAFALGKAKRDGSLFFDYSILNAAGSDSNIKSDSTDSTEKLDSQCWFDNVKTLDFPSEVRVVGEEAVPVYELPAVDRTGKVISRTRTDTLDQWLSTSLCLMDPDVTNFEVFTDGKYIYIFRQSRGRLDSFLNRFTKTSPPVDANLLCDRFSLVGSTLNRTLEVRYRRSRQKRLPLNERDTLAARDINDVPFYEPTVSLTFVRHMLGGRFSVLQTPTTTTGISKWMIFAFSAKTNQIECFATDVSTDGLFDIHGQIYYTCDAEGHEPTFSTSPGTCSLTNEKTEKTCGCVRKALVPKAALSERALCLDDKVADADLTVKNPIDLSGPKFSKGFTLEAWVKPLSNGLSPLCETVLANKPNGTEQSGAQSALAKSSKLEAGSSGELSLPTARSRSCLFSLTWDDLSPDIFIDDQLRLVVQFSGESSVSGTSGVSLKADVWNHVAITYTRGQQQTFQFVVDGAATDAAPFACPIGANPGKLNLFVGENDAGEPRFRGQLDEVRLWHYPLHSETIKAKMSNRATGMEPFLEACWHFDEGTGLQAFDATMNGHDIDIDLGSATSSTSDIWVASTAPILGNFGLARKVIRLPPNVSVTGGIGSSVYYEQVSAPEPDSKAKDDSAKDETAAKSDPQPLKRGGRVLLCFVASVGSGASCLSVLDFELTSDGTLGDWPAILPIPSLSVSSSDNTGRKRASTTLLYVDGEGRETFGGMLDFDAARCASNAPSVWESSTGTISVYFKDASSSFAALTYDVSRTIIAGTLVGLSGHPGVRAASKLRMAQKITASTTANSFAPENVLVDLRITAVMVDGTKVVETWLGMPSNLEGLCNLLNGSNVPTAKKLGNLAKSLRKVSQDGDESSFGSYEVALSQPLIEKIPSATCIMIGQRRFFVLQEGEVSHDCLVVSPPYDNAKPGLGLPEEGQEVICLGYDHENLLQCEGKPDGESSQGSALLRIALVQTDATLSTAPAPYLVRAGKEASISCQGRAPFFSSPATSRALRIGNDGAYSMLEDATTTIATPGIAFESWIKVDQVGESAIVAYASERLPRSEKSSPEQQVFVLGIPASSNNKSDYELVGNVNGTLFSVKDSRTMQQGRWVHFACSLHNTLALRFSGSNFVNVGTASEWNVQNFTIAFTLQLDEIGRNQVVFTKGASADDNMPFHITVTTSNTISLTYWGDDEDKPDGWRRCTVQSPSQNPLAKGKPYKIFISRALLRINRQNEVSKSAQGVTMRAWGPDGSQLFDLQPPSVDTILKGSASNNPYLQTSTPAQVCGTIKASESPLLFGGAPWAFDQGLFGVLGHVRIYSAALPVPSSAAALSTINSSERSLIGSWSFRGGDTEALIDDLGRNHGKLRLEPKWIISPYTPDHQLSVYVNGVRASTTMPTASVLLRTPAGPHQLTLGNSVHGDDVTRFQALRNGFKGELDELRIWDIPRTRENICDTMNARLSEVPPEIAVYLPFDDSEDENSITGVTPSASGLLADASINCWHLTHLHGARTPKIFSQAPVGHDASCVRHALSNTVQSEQITARSKTSSQPSVTEYGDMQVSASGSLEGAYKRAYSNINMQGEWCLNTGFRIGTLVTEWISQVQTSPTLIGYIEGAPPIPAENFLDKDNPPSSSIKFSNAQKVSYSYGLQTEEGTEFNMETAVGIGAKWEVTAGVGVETEISAGEIKGAVKRNIDISGAKVNNNVSTSETNTNLEMGMQLTGGWVKPADGGAEVYVPANSGLALVESEVADVFALRLKTRSAISPLVAYQMRPNPDIPKDRNLVSFAINKSYTKQGCLDGRYGLETDEDYVPSQDAPKDASYYKPAEAYALKDRIRRAEEQLEGEYARYQLRAKKAEDLPSRTHRNICNSYVWTADGGTFQETHSTMDFVQTEVNVSENFTSSLGGSFDMEVSAGSFLVTTNIDALYSTSVNVMQTKDKSSEKAFALEAELPPAVEIRDDQAGKLVKRPGAVDTYRWMSFWLEPSVEGTDAFFKQVVDPVWLEQSTESNAKLLLGLREDLSRQTGNARTKAWRVLHRVTYVNRVLERVPTKLSLPQVTQLKQIEKKGMLLADVSCNWLILQHLEPFVRGATSRSELARLAQEHIAELYPTIRAQPRLYAQILDLLADFVGVE